MYICTHICIYMYIYIHTHIYMYIYTHIYVCTYIHTHIYIYTHTHVYSTNLVTENITFLRSALSIKRHFTITKIKPTGRKYLQ